MKLRHLGLVVLAAIAIGGCATTRISDSLWTTVTGEGRQITLRLDPEHPRLRQMSTANINLAADFVDDSGTPRTAALGAGSRVDAFTRVYTLPESLNNPPQGEVCLYFANPDPRMGAIPVRTKGSVDGSDTSGFRYPTWEARIGPETRKRLHTWKRSELEGQRTRLIQSIGQLEASLRDNQYQSEEDCARRAVARKLERTRDIVDPPAQATVARRVCVRRTRELNRQTKFNFISAITQSRSQLSADRTRQAARFQADWAAYAERTGTDYTPEIGDLHETLSLANNAEVLAKRPELLPSETLALLGAYLDAYDVCVQDTTRQLGQRYQLWQTGQNRSADRAAAYSDFLAQECRGKFARRNEQKTRLASVEANLANLEQPPTAFTANTMDGGKVLNFFSCKLPTR